MKEFFSRFGRWLVRVTEAHTDPHTHLYEMLREALLLHRAIEEADESIQDFIPQFASTEALRVARIELEQQLRDRLQKDLNRICREIYRAMRANRACRTRDIHVDRRLMGKKYYRHTDVRAALVAYRAHMLDHLPGYNTPNEKAAVA